VKEQKKKNGRGGSPRTIPVPQKNRRMGDKRKTDRGKSSKGENRKGAAETDEKRINTSRTTETQSGKKEKSGARMVNWQHSRENLAQAAAQGRRPYGAKQEEEGEVKKKPE